MIYRRSKGAFARSAASGRVPSDEEIEQELKTQAHCMAHMDEIDRKYQACLKRKRLGRLSFYAGENGEFPPNPPCRIGMIPWQQCCERKKNC